MAGPKPYILESPAGREVMINGRQYLYFAGTGYFELHHHPDLINAAAKASEAFGMASATSRGMTGTTPLVRELERKAASFFGSEAAVYLPSGYLSNLAGLSALNEMGRFDRIFVDIGSHYSLLEGSLATGKPVVTFQHCDAPDLARQLDHHLEEGEHPLIACDGVFPAEAKLAPIPEYLELARRSDGILWIDDAHGAGILGDKGRGSCEYFRITSDRVFQGTTLSKAFGSYGGIIHGRREFIDRVMEGNVMMGSSAPLNAAVAAGIRGFEIIEDQPVMREKLWENARYLKAQLGSLQIPTEDNPLPIVAFAKGNGAGMKKLQQALMEEGIFVQYSRYRGSGREGMLRIVVFSTHTKEQIDRLMDSLKRNLMKIS